jgi:hypothetical protein
MGMAEQYHIDLEAFTLEEFRHVLETGDLLPSRVVLKEKISERFAILESMGVGNLKELIGTLSTKKKLEKFSQESGLPEDYLVILRRQARSYIPSPVYLKDIPGVDPRVVERLAAAGIKQTKQLFERARSREDRAELSRQADVPGEVVLELVKMADLARAGWVGPVFVRLLYEAGADTLEALSRQSPDALYEKLLAVNKEQQLTKASFSVKDVASCIETAKALPKVVEY